uniref:Small ribosomal subunit protein uS8c n=2 Tax=Aegilops tauschii TaxID=37682 RepID=A0A453SZN0_AEGTS
MGRRILNDALRTMVNAERRGKAMAQLQPISGVMISFLNIMKHRGYIKNFEVFDPHRVGKITVELQGRIKDCKALTYRQDLKAMEIEKYRTRMLPTRQACYQLIFDFCEHSYLLLVEGYSYLAWSILILLWILKESGR